MQGQEPLVAPTPLPPLPRPGETRFGRGEFLTSRPSPVAAESLSTAFQPSCLESLQQRIAGEAGAKEDAKCILEALSQSLNISILRLKEACRSDLPEEDMAEGWLLRRVWQFCDEVQDQLRVARAPGNSATAATFAALAASLASVQKRHAALSKEVDRQTARKEELTAEVAASADAEGRLQEVLTRQQQMVLLTESRSQSQGSTDQIVLQLKRDQATREMELEASFEDLRSRSHAFFRTEQDTLRSKLQSMREELAATQVEIARLRTQHTAAAIDVREWLDSSKAALAMLSSTMSAWLAQVEAAAVSEAAQTEDKIQHLQAQLASSKETAACELESWDRKGLALKAEAEAVSNLAAEETSRLAAELLAMETQRSMISRSLSDEAGAAVSVLRDGVVQSASLQVDVDELLAEVQHLEAELRAVAQERQMLQEEHRDAFERQLKAEEALQKALSDNEMVRQQMEAQRVEMQLASEAAIREVDSAAGAALHAAAEAAEAEFGELEDVLDALEKELAENRARCSQLHLQEASLQRDKASLERERSMWKAQHELTQSLQSEARDAMKEARNSWAQEVRSLKDQVKETTRKKELLEAKMQDVEAAAEASQTEVSQGVVETRRKAQLLESQIDEVKGLCAPVQKALERQAAAFSSAQKEVEERRSQTLQASSTMQMELEHLAAQQQKERQALEAELSFERERMLRAQASNHRRASDSAANADLSQVVMGQLMLGDASTASYQDADLRLSQRQNEEILAATRERKKIEMERHQRALDLAESENRWLKQLASSGARAGIAESIERMQRRTEQLRHDIGVRRDLEDESS
eukprot:s8_g7.t1